MSREDRLRGNNDEDFQLLWRVCLWSDLLIMTKVSLQYHSGLNWRWSGGMGCAGWKMGQIVFFIFSIFKLLARAVLFISLLAFNLRVSNFEVKKVFRPTHLSITFVFQLTHYVTASGVACLTQKGGQNGDWNKVDMKKISRSVCNWNLSPNCNVIRSSFTL